MLQRAIFDGWAGPVRTLVVGCAAYIVLLVVLRISGKRTLSKMNAFDLVVTVALGSTFGAILLNKDVALVQGGVAFMLLAGMQFLVTWSSVRSELVQRLVKSQPTMLAYRGEYLPVAMRRERVTKEEVEAALRSNQLERLEQVELVVLETDGTLSIIPTRNSDDAPPARCPTES